MTRTWIIFGVIALALMGWRLLRFALSTRPITPALRRIESALRERSTIFVYSLIALGSLVLVGFAYLEEAPPLPHCRLQAAAAIDATLSNVTTTAITSSPSPLPTRTPVATATSAGGGAAVASTVVATKCELAAASSGGATPTPEAGAASAVAPNPPGPNELTPDEAARSRWSGLKDWLPEDLHGLALYAVWFGALGGVVASLKGIYDHANDWDKSNALWHYGRPFSAGVVGGVTYILLLVASAQNQTALATPAILVVSFALGTQDKRFFNLLYDMTKLVVGSPGDQDSVALTIGTVQPDRKVPGGEIAILGAGFLKGARLSFDGRDTDDPVSVTDDGTRINAKVPAPRGALPPGAVDVAVVNPNGIAYVKAAAFTYAEPAAAAAPVVVESASARLVPAVVAALLQAITDAGEKPPVELTPEVEQAIRTSVSEAVANVPGETAASEQSFADQAVAVIKGAWDVISSDEVAPIRALIIRRFLEANPPAAEPVSTGELPAGEAAVEAAVEEE